MKISIIKAALRVIGTLAGLAGVSIIAFSLPVVYEGMRRSPLFLLFAAMQLLFAAFLIYTAVLVWRRFSPLAVKHACAVGALLVWWPVSHYLSPPLHPGSDDAGSLRLALYIAWFAGVFITYRIASDRFSRALFPDGHSLPIADRPRDVANRAEGSSAGHRGEHDE